MSIKEILKFVKRTNWLKTIQSTSSKFYKKLPFGTIVWRGQNIVKLYGHFFGSFFTAFDYAFAIKTQPSKVQGYMVMEDLILLDLIYPESIQFINNLLQSESEKAKLEEMFDLSGGGGIRKSIAKYDIELSKIICEKTNIDGWIQSEPVPGIRGRKGGMHEEIMLCHPEDQIRPIHITFIPNFIRSFQEEDYIIFSIYLKNKVYYISKDKLVKWKRKHYRDEDPFIFFDQDIKIYRNY